jgi:hypothetical protein
MRARDRPAVLAALLALALGAPACGDEDGPGEEASDGPETTLATGTTAPIDPEAAAEASPEAGGAGGGEALAPDDEEAVTAVVRRYVDGLNAADGAALCALLAPGALEEVDLSASGGCPRSLEGSIGTKPDGGAPAWKRTNIVEVKAVSVAEDRARVTATVTHRFSDRKYTSIEEDVIYLDRSGDGAWLVAKPSLTLYRAVGYRDPPLRALTPPD